MRHRLITVLGLLVVTAVAAAAAGAALGFHASSEKRRNVKFELRIGDVLPFTGDLAAYGGNLDKAVKLAVQLENESLKRLKLSKQVSVKLVASEDGQTKAQASVEAATKLVKVDKVNVVIGEMASGATIPVAQSVTVPNRIVQITPTSTAPQISDIKDNGYLWRILASDNLQGRVLAQAAAGAFGAKSTINIAARNDAFGTALKGLFIAQWKKGGGSIGQDVLYNPNQSSFDTDAQKIVEGNPKGFVIIDFPTTFEKLAPALFRTGKWSASRTLMTEAMRNADELGKIGAQGTDGLRGTAPTSQGAPARAAFDRLYKARVKGAKAITGFEGSSFDAAMLSFLAALKGGSSKPAVIKANLRAVSGPPGVKVTFGQLDKAVKLLLDGKEIDYEGAWGPADFDAKGDPGSAVFELWKYSNGAISTEKTFTFKG